ncbi:MAG: luciferase family protein [Solirubrobacteraceae bacterium]
MSTKEHAAAGDRPGPATRIIDTVGSWSGVELAPHRFGGVELRLGRRELGHLHGDRIADLPFPRRVRDELVAAGRARPHHVLPESGWVTLSTELPDGVERAIELFALSYERALRARRTPATLPAAEPSDG